MTAAGLMARLAALGRDFTPAQMAASRELFASRVLRPEQVAGCTVTRDVAYGEDARHRLDLFAPAAGSAARPVFVFVHGGGFVQGDKGAPDAPFYNNFGAWAVRAACDRAGLPRVGAHRLRHTAATGMLQAGASLPEIGQVLRHREPKTTAIYAKVDHAALRALARPWPTPGGVS